MASLASHGRGGAGNIARASLSPKLQPEDLETPTLKTPVVTTGRGGTGNMAANKDPIETRLRQDVEASAQQHAGRGGAGNVFKGDDEALVDELMRKSSNEYAVSDDHHESLADKGKNWLLRRMS